MPFHSTRIPLLALAVLAFATPSFASGNTITFLGGMNTSNVTGGNEIFTPQSKLGFVSGLAFGIPIGDRFSVVPEAGYTLRGFSWGTSNTVDSGGNVTGTFETLTVTDVLTLSCSARARFALGRTFQANVSLGPTVGFEIAERFTPNGYGFADFLRDTDWGALAEVGADMHAGPGRVGLGVRYVHGFSDLSRDPLVTRHTRVVEFVASYTASLGH
jgi:hypothetical protein